MSKFTFLSRGEGSTPVSNLIQLEPIYREEFLKRQMEVYSRKHVTGLSSISFHKSILGCQTYCLTLTRRYWIWEFPETGLRLWVHNIMGVSPEVLTTHTKHEAMAAMRVYWATVGV